VQHGAVVSLGYVVSNCLKQQQSQGNSDGCHDNTPMDTGIGEKLDLVKRALKRLSKSLVDCAVACECSFLLSLQFLWSPR